MAKIIENTRLGLEAKAAKADMKSKCGMVCPFFLDCRPLFDKETFGRKIFDLCSSKFREGYRKGYNQCKRDKRKNETTK